MDKNIRINLFKQLPFSKHIIEDEDDEVTIILKEIMLNVLSNTVKINHGAGDTKGTNTGVTKIPTKPKRRRRIEKIWYIWYLI